MQRLADGRSSEAECSRLDEIVASLIERFRSTMGCDPTGMSMELLLATASSTDEMWDRMENMTLTPEFTQQYDELEFTMRTRMHGVAAMPSMLHLDDI